MKLADELTEGSAEHALERDGLRRDDMHLEPAGEQGSSHLEPNEAGADDHGAALAVDRLDDLP